MRPVRRGGVFVGPDAAACGRAGGAVRPRRTHFLIARLNRRRLWDAWMAALAVVFHGGRADVRQTRGFLPPCKTVRRSVRQELFSNWDNLAKSYVRMTRQDVEVRRKLGQARNQCLSYAERAKRRENWAKISTKVAKIFSENVLCKLLWLGRQRVRAGQSGLRLLIGFRGC